MAHYRAVVTLLAGALALGGCAANAQSSCTQPPVQSYPTVQLVAPTNGSSDVSPTVGTVTLQTTGSQLFGTVTLTGPGDTIDLQPKPVANAGNELDFVAHIPALASSASYSVRYVLSYPGGCQGPNVVDTESVGSFSTD